MHSHVYNNFIITLILIITYYTLHITITYYNNLKAFKYPKLYYLSLPFCFNFILCNFSRL